MNKTILSQQEARPSPYTDLYIYYLKGRLGPDDPIGDPEFIGNWEEEDTSFLFFSKPRRKLIRQLVGSRPHLKLLDDYHMTYDEWQGERFSAFHAGRFFFVPPWDTRPSETTDITIHLDPGLVFGNGTHPTTKDCLAALELVFSHQTIPSILDLGCGTGILSLAAAKLGGTRVLACDTNALATRTARRNVCLNGLEDHILVTKSAAETCIELHSDLVLANIHYDVMKTLIRQDGFLNKKWFILSGILRSQAKEVIDVLRRRPVRMLRQWDCNGIWHTLCGKIDGSATV